MKRRRTGAATETPAEKAYTRIHGPVPAWVRHLPSVAAARLLAAATNIGMKLAVIDHHAAEDAKRPKLGQMRPPAQTGGGPWLQEFLARLRSVGKEGL